MIESNTAIVWNIEISTPSEAGRDLHAKHGVVNWVNKIEGADTYWINFYSDMVPGVSNIGDYIGKKSSRVYD